MAKPKKNVLAIMLGGKPEEGAPPEEAPDESMDPMFGAPGEEEDFSEYGEAFSESAESAFNALQGGDVEVFKSALKDAIITCVEDNNAGEY